MDLEDILAWIITIPIFVFLVMIETWAGKKNKWLRKKIGIN